MSRRADRKHAFCLIFQLEFNDSYYKQRMFDRYRESEPSLADADLDIVRDSFFGVCDNQKRIDGIIAELAVGWSFPRLSKIDLALLRFGVYEILFTGISDKIAVNEAVELAKTYSDDESGSFINGILASVIKQKDSLRARIGNGDSQGENLEREPD